MLDVTLLSVLQGIAEFLPVSSSGHLVLGKQLLGMSEVGIRLDIFLHVGTLAAVFAFYFAIIRRILLRREWSYLAKVVLSAVPAGLVGVLFKDELEGFFASPSRVGAALVFTGVVLTLTRFLPRGGREVGFGSALWMGVAQAIAIIPGVSRSGMTLVAARAAKVEAEKSAEFSFLMSAPPIAGAALLEVLKSLKGGETTVEASWGLCVYGALVAAVVGYFSLKLLLKSLKSDRFWLFGPYCLLVGVLTVGWARPAASDAAAAGVVTSPASVETSSVVNRIP